MVASEMLIGKQVLLLCAEGLQTVLVLNSDTPKIVLVALSLPYTVNCEYTSFIGLLRLKNNPRSPVKYLMTDR